jgi:hypothetical protein
MVRTASSAQGSFFTIVWFQIQKPAPAFEADAVVDGQIKKISLSQFKGK